MLNTNTSSFISQTTFVTEKADTQASYQATAFSFWKKKTETMLNDSWMQQTRFNVLQFFYLFLSVLYCTCFRRFSAHHQELIKL